MTTVKEVELKKDGEMVTPITIIDSVKNLDGTNYKDHKHDDRYYTKNEVNDKNYLKATLLEPNEETINIDQYILNTKVGEVYPVIIKSQNGGSVACSYGKSFVFLGCNPESKQVIGSPISYTAGVDVLSGQTLVGIIYRLT